MKRGLSYVQGEMLWINSIVLNRTPPNTILIEYVPNIQAIDLSTSSKTCLGRLREILDEIYEAKVLHGDPKPRNMMVSLGKQDRVLWIDFDSAQTFPEGLLSPKQKL